MVFAAAGLAGLGGLLLQLALVRRHGLLLGNTAEAAALVLALFLLGLGLGGLYGPRLPLARRRPLGSAALAYALVALAAVTADSVLARMAPVGWLAGLVLALLAPGLPTLCMGAAFPLLFSALPSGSHPVRSGMLVAVNLLGAVVGTFWGGNIGIPELGLTRCTWLAAGAYGVAALLVALRSRFERRSQELQPPPLPKVGFPEVAVFAAGLLVLGLEVYMLRRLPFFLDGFQPTLAGVVTACVLGLTLGAAVGTPLLLRFCRGRAVVMSIALCCGVLALGLHEGLAGWLGRLGVGSDLGFHLRILSSAAVAAGLPCFFLGATIPLCLAAYVHPETRAPLAGRLFFCEGLGALCGAMLVSHLLPAAWPGGFFVLALPALSLVGLLLCWWWHRLLASAAMVLVLVLAATGVSGAGSLLAPDPPVLGSRYDRPWYRHVAHRTDSVLCASVVYDRSAHSMILFTDEFRAAYSGPSTGYMKVLAHLPFLLRERLQRVAVIALGTGTTANAVTTWPGPGEIHAVEISPSVVDLVDHFAGAGPGRADTKRAAFLADRPRTRLHVTDGRRFVARRQAASLDLISMEPLLPYAPGTVPLYTREFYRLCERALSEHGLMVQWVPTHAMPKEFYRTLLRTFAQGFRHHSVWLFDQSTLLVGSKTPHLPAPAELARRLRAAPAAARRDLHEAGIASVTDLLLAFVATDVATGLQDASLLTDDRPFLERIGYWSGRRRLGFFPENLGVLVALADAGPPWPAGPEGPGVRRWRRDRLVARRDLASGHPARALMVTAAMQSSLPSSVLLHREVTAALR
ncbi:MAG: fused MFS/spermidine synthase, partial [Planctomycetota bacterium]